MPKRLVRDGHRCVSEVRIIELEVLDARLGGELRTAPFADGRSRSGVVVDGLVAGAWR